MGTEPSCARTDAKTQNRDLQMKYDIAKNEDGPLRKTMKASMTTNTSDTQTFQRTSSPVDVPTKERYPALDERIKDIETHVSVKYGEQRTILSYHQCAYNEPFLVPSPPRSLLDRLRFVEDHLIHLEKEYPPWAALHFTQPRRGVSCNTWC